MKTVMIKTSSGKKLQCTISPKSIHIKDSYLVSNKKEMKIFINHVREYASEACGYTYMRSEKQWLHEWRAHNLLYKLDYQPKRTGSVDLDENETDKRNTLYRILSFLYNFIH